MLIQRLQFAGLQPGPSSILLQVHDLKLTLISIIIPIVVFIILFDFPDGILVRIFRILLLRLLLQHHRGLTVILIQHCPILTILIGHADLLLISIFLLCFLVSFLLGRER